MLHASTMTSSSQTVCFAWMQDNNGFTWSCAMLPLLSSQGENAEVNFDRDFSSAPADTRVNVVSSVFFLSLHDMDISAYVCRTCVKRAFAYSYSSRLVWLGSFRLTLAEELEVYLKYGVFSKFASVTAPFELSSSYTQALHRWIAWRRRINAAREEPQTFSTVCFF